MAPLSLSFSLHFTEGAIVSFAYQQDIGWTAFYCLGVTFLL